MTIKLHGKNVNVKLTYDEFMTQVHCLFFLGFIGDEDVRRIRSILTKRANSLIIHATVHSVVELLFFEMLWAEDEDDHQTTR